MAFVQLKRNYRKLRRIRQIAAVFFRYRLGELISLSRGHKFRAVLNSAERTNIAEWSLAKRFRHALEELGPTFIKFGQMLSTRPDLVPRDFIEELSSLQDNAWNSAAFDIETVLEEEWGSAADGIFQQFDAQPISVASLSHVYRGVLKTGDPVAIKVQKPGILDTITVDMDVLRDVAKLWKKRSATGWIYQPELMVDEFSKVIKRELNFLQEAQNYEKFRHNFRGDETVKFPKVHQELTTARVLTMEFIDGVKITDVGKPEWQGKFDPPLVVKRGVDVFLKQAFEDGFFHADPHPANILVLPGNIIVPLDVGMVSWLDEKTMQAAMKVFDAFIHKNPNQAVRAFEELGMKKGEIDNEQLSLDLREFVSHYHGLTLQNLNLGTMASDLIEILASHRLVIPRNLVLIIKAFATIENIGQQVDSNFNLFEHVRPFLAKLSARHITPAEFWEKAKKIFHEAMDVAAAIPQEFFWFIEKFREGKIKLIFEHKGLEHFGEVIERSANRISLSIVLASVILSLALMIHINDLMPLLGAVGIFGIAVAVGWAAWIVFLMTRSGRR